MRALPSLGSVAKDTTSGFLPANVPSIKASNMASPFIDVNLGTATLIAVRDGGLTAADNSAIDAIETQIKGIDTVKVVVDLGISGDGAARQVLIEAESWPSSPDGGGPSDLVAAIRNAATAAAPAGLQTHLTGEIPTIVDNANASGASQDRTQSLSLLFIIVLLVLAYRALLAPFVTLIPAVIVLTLSGPVIAQAASAGIQVSSITQFMLIVLILGAGTDYGVFLVFRVRGGAAPRPLRPGRGEARRGPRRRVDHLLGVHRDRRALERGARGVRAVPEHGSRHWRSASPHAGGRASPCSRRSWRSSAGRSSGRATSATRRSSGGASGIASASIATRRPAVTLILGAVLFGGMAVDSADHRDLGFRRPWQRPPPAPIPRPGRPRWTPTSHPRRSCGRWSCSSSIARCGTTRASLRRRRPDSAPCPTSRASWGRSIRTASRSRPSQLTQLHTALGPPRAAAAGAAHDIDRAHGALQRLSERKASWSAPTV